MLPCILDLTWIPVLAAIPFAILTAFAADPIGFYLEGAFIPLEIFGSLGLFWASTLLQRMVLCPFDLIPILPG